MSTFCLTVHAGYACRHTGACCSAPWRIPLERETVPLLLRHAELAAILDRTHGESDLARHKDGTCVFFESERGRLCAIHRVAGEERLPSACRHFPRVVRTDPRGSFITLSSFCPTAAALLAEPGPLRVVKAPPSLIPAGTLEGLDATAVLPPLLRPGLLMDYDGYSAWEHAGVAMLDRDDLDVDEAIDAIAIATRRVQEWTPGPLSLASHVTRAFRDLAPTVRAARTARPERMFAAAHLFASWAAYQDGGVAGVVHAVREAVARLKREIRAGQSFVAAARATDHDLRHTQRDLEDAGA
ncbi:MAG TPA: YkgJ family cysteine cluster protein [Vicinamibacterales bacterium]|nr:YkgJ family cysteine cluster protein [Vicinamibacterales bacterium]